MCGRFLVSRALEKYWSWMMWVECVLEVSSDMIFQEVLSTITESKFWKYQHTVSWEQRLDPLLIHEAYLILSTLLQNGSKRTSQLPFRVIHTHGGYNRLYNSTVSHNSFISYLEHALCHTHRQPNSMLFHIKCVTLSYHCQCKYLSFKMIGIHFPGKRQS